MKEVSEKYLKEIYLNVLKAIVILFYFLVLNLAYEKVNSEYLERGIQIFTMIFLFIAIYIFEKAYKKDDAKLAIQGIEVLILAAYTLTTKHITNKFNFNFKNYSALASYLYSIYFILKGIVVYTKGRKEIAESLSDIREIVKKEEPVKKEATKKIKNKENKVVKDKESKIQKNQVIKEPIKKKKRDEGKKENIEKSKKHKTNEIENANKVNNVKKIKNKNKKEVKK